MYIVYGSIFLIIYIFNTKMQNYYLHSELVYKLLLIKKNKSSLRCIICSWFRQFIYFWTVKIIFMKRKKITFNYTSHVKSTPLVSAANLHLSWKRVLFQKRSITLDISTFSMKPITTSQWKVLKDFYKIYLYSI